MAYSGKKVGLIGAMAEEVELILGSMEQKRQEKKAGLDFTSGIFCGKPVVVVKSGVGKVNAAVCTQILIDRFEVDTVIFTGVAGALDPALEIGDIVVSSECMYHDVDVTALGFSKGMIPYEDVSVFPSDPELSRLALESSSELFGDRTRQGRVLSGDQFIADRELVLKLHEELQGTCTEMEGASVAHVCVMNGVPHVIIRSMSDKADGSAQVNFQQFTALASEHSYRIVERMLRTF